MDVCQLIIKKSTSQTQEGQLSDYFLDQKEGVIIYELDKNQNDNQTAQNDNHIQIKLCNQAISQIMGFEACESSYSFEIPKAVREKPTFKITAIDSESFDEEARTDYTSLWDVLLDPKFLEHTETSAILK